RRLSRSFDFSAATAPLDGIRTRIHEGLRSTGASTNCTGDRAILSPATCFTPGTRDGGASATTSSGMDLAAGMLVISFLPRIYADKSGFTRIERKGRKAGALATDLRGLRG